MVASSLLYLVFGGLSSAATLGRSYANKRDTSNLTADDVIVFGEDGRTEVWPKAKYEWLTSIDSTVFSLNSATPNGNITMPVSNSTTHSNSSALAERGCAYRDIIVENPDSSFLGWDVPMTSVIHATGLTSTVSISSGYSIADSIAVAVGSKLTLVKDFLDVSYSITYTETWTTTTTQAYMYYVYPGNYAAMVTNARTLRKSGNVYSGCIGDAQEAAYYQADSFSSQVYGDLAWVSGVISLCNGTAYPLPMCLGGGFLY